MYQLQDSRLLNSKHNSIVFTHIEILNHIFIKTAIMCESIKEASGELCCVVDEILWTASEVGYRHVDLFHRISILIFIFCLFFSFVSSAEHFTVLQ